MNAANNKEHLQIRNRQRFELTDPKIIEPTKFRSWREQSLRSDQKLPSQGLGPERRRKSSLWRNRDLIRVIALAVTAAIAGAIYYSLK